MGKRNFYDTKCASLVIKEIDEIDRYANENYLIIINHLS